MNTALKNSFVDNIYTDWQDSDVKYICLDIFEYVIRTHPKHLVYLSYASLYKITKLDSDSLLDKTNLLLSIQYLIGDRVPILSMFFELMGNNKDTYPITDDDARLALNEGKVIHPVTGEEITDMSKVIIYFAATDLVKSINVYCG